MRWGLVARAETSRGLGVQSYGIYENLSPDKVLVVNANEPFDTDFDRYQNATLIETHGGKLDQYVVKDWLVDLDVVVSVETVYDPRFIGWANDCGTKTIIQGNPEFVGRETLNPTMWWWPSSWRLDKLPEGRLVPVPVTLYDFVKAPANNDQVNFIHVGGRKALGDRNGTDLVTQAVQRIDRSGMHIKLFGQDFEPNRLLLRRPRVSHEIIINPTNDEMYNHAHVLILPRRYAGNCLPAIEALGHGMVVMMTDISPNRDWPIYPLPANLGKTLTMPCGQVETYSVDPRELANQIMTVAGDRNLLNRYLNDSRDYALQNSWEAKKQFYYDEIEYVYKNY